MENNAESRNILQKRKPDFRQTFLPAQCGHGAISGKPLFELACKLHS